jgi:uncharacterized membrane protein YphA (DoxX/SURF4 family)
MALPLRGRREADIALVVGRRLPGQPAEPARQPDFITMWGLTLVGVFLILGLFTRLASLAGIGFILLFYLCNPPLVGYFYSIPTEGSYLIVNKTWWNCARSS